MSRLFAALIFGVPTTYRRLDQVPSLGLCSAGAGFCGPGPVRAGGPLAAFLRGRWRPARGCTTGLLVSWRLLLIILAGVFLSTTTRAAEVKAGVQWLLDPVPLVPAGRVATMMGLILRFMPLVLEQARETAAAQRARGVENRKNPVYRLRVYAVPLLRRSFERADRLALAMEARCYSEQRGLAGFRRRRSTGSPWSWWGGSAWPVLLYEPRGC